MYGIFTYIWLIYMVNVGKYTILESYGSCLPSRERVHIPPGEKVTSSSKVP